MISVQLPACDGMMYFQMYNIEGNVWMQLNQPDSAVAYYEKSHIYRLKGEKGHLLSDICMNLADAHLHRGELAHTASLLPESIVYL